MALPVRGGALTRRGRAAARAIGVVAALALGLAGCGERDAKTRRVLVIGLDGATWDLLEPMIRDGALPNIARLRESGSWGPLESVTPPLSAPAWTTAVTGVNPGRHGVLDFVLVDPATYGLRMATSRDRKTPAIWDHLGRAGRRAGIINIPLTSPPDSIDGFMIGGFPHVDTTGIFFPEVIAAELGPYRLDPYGERLPPGHEDEFLADICSTLDSKRDTALRLMKTQDWDFLWVVFMASDKAQHFFWRYIDPENPAYRADAPAALRGAIADVWRRLDDAVGALVEASGHGTTVVILSDHGFGPVRREFRVLPWLRREGYLAARPEDWQRSAFLTFSIYGGALFANDARFPAGVVADSARPALLADASSRLAAVVEPGRAGGVDSGPVLDGIVTKDAIYSGPWGTNAPDLMFEGAPGWLVSRGGLAPTDSVFGPPSYTFSGYHRPDGIVVAAGPGIARGARVSGARLLDVAPTLLYLAGAPVPRALEGRVLETLIEAARLARDPIRFEEVDLERTPEEIEAIRAVPYIR